MPSADNELWDRGHPRQPGDNAGSIARQTVCKWRSHRERKFFVLSSYLACAPIPTCFPILTVTATQPPNQEGLDDAFTSAAGRDRLRTLGGTVIGDRCYATVLL